MSLTSFIRLGVVALAGSAVANIIADFPPDPATGVLNFVGVALGVLGLSAVFVHLHDRAGWLAYAGYVLATLGFVGIAGFLFADAAIFPALPAETVDALVNGATGGAIFAAVILYVVGVVTFCAGAWRTRRLPGWALALWAVGTVPTLVAVMLPALVLTISEILVSLGILGVTRRIWLDTGARGATTGV